MSTSTVLIFCGSTNPRLVYVLDLVLVEWFGWSYETTNNHKTFTAFRGARLNYSTQSFPEVPSISPDTILFEDRIKPDLPVSVEKNGLPVLFPSDGEGIGFDPLAAIFFMVSRYEEYVVKDRDQHGRFPAEASLAFKNDFLQKPIAHYWAEELLEYLKKFNELSANGPVFSHTSTIDVDAAFAYKGKGWLRNLGGLAKDLTNLRIEQVLERIQVLNGSAIDPFDTFRYLQDLHLDSSNLHFFILMAEWGTYDKNVAVDYPGFQTLLKRLSEHFPVSLHPSYKTMDDENTLAKEKQVLEKVLGTSIEASRQHYLRFDLPQTYRLLVAQGITNDYTMGYASQVGFRAGVARPFYFFDLEQNKQTELRVHPFMVMDVTLRHYLKLNATQAIEVIDQLINETRTVGGAFVSLWHNETLSDRGPWKGWRIVYERMLQKGSQA